MNRSVARGRKGKNGGRRNRNIKRGEEGEE